MTIDTSLTIRRLTEADQAPLTALAGLDSSRAPVGPVLGAEADGALVAALSLADGTVIADPFRRTAEAVALLRLRAKQVQAGRRRRRKRARAALPASPPGAGGRLVSLPVGQLTPR